MTDLIKQSWRSFKTSPDVWFFYAFLITSTLTIRKVLYFLPINNSFNEYTGAYIYLSDIFLILTFLFYILYNIKSILSNITIFLTNILLTFKMFHVEHFKRESKNNSKCSTWNNWMIALNNVPRGTFLFIKKTYSLVINNYLTIFPLFIAFFSLFSILWTINKPIAIYRSIKLFEFVLLYFYIIHNVPRGTLSKNTNNLSVILARMFHVEHFKNNTINDTRATTPENNTGNNCSTWNNLLNKLNVPRGTFSENIMLIIIATGVIQSIVGILQFIKQSSIGLFWLKESLISPSIPGVAKIILDGDVYIRAYGLFPHPNVFGGFLVFTILISSLYIKMFHACPVGCSQSETCNCSTWNNPPQTTSTPTVAEHSYWGGTMLLRLIIFIQLIALLLTFSKSAILGLLIGLFYISYSAISKIVPRGTIPNDLKKITTNIKCSTWNIIKEKYLDMIKMFHVEHYKRKVTLLVLIALSLFVILKPNLNSLFIKSLQERELYLNVSRGTFLEHPLIGIGAGQFVLNMQTNHTLENWQYQPVHNVFLLILNEFGIFLFLGFIYFIYKLFHPRSNVPRGTIARGRRGTYYGGGTIPELGSYLKSILLAFIFIMLFDHYFWDIQQGQIMLWVLLALIASQKKNIAAVGN